MSEIKIRQLLIRFSWKMNNCFDSSQQTYCVSSYSLPPSWSVSFNYHAKKVKKNTFDNLFDWNYLCFSIAVELSLNFCPILHQVSNNYISVIILKCSKRSKKLIWQVCSNVHHSSISRGYPMSQLTLIPKKMNPVLISAMKSPFRQTKTWTWFELTELIVSRKKHITSKIAKLRKISLSWHVLDARKIQQKKYADSAITCNTAQIVMNKCI